MTLNSTPHVPGEELPRRFGVGSATLVVAANRIGTGVFTTGGLLLRDLGSPMAVLIAWLVGGLLVLAGALTYGELASFYGRNGGEYRFLSELYHPAVGFVAGWLSLVVGTPKRNLPVALGVGTTLVLLLYMALNTAFLVSAPYERLAGIVEVGHVAAVSLLGARIGKLSVPTLPACETLGWPACRKKGVCPCSVYCLVGSW